MCDSIDLGGAKCAAHTRPRYDALIEALDAARGTDGRKRVRSTFKADGENAINIVADYASTPTGAKRIAADIARYESEKYPDRALVTFLRANHKRGLDRGAERKAATREIKATKRREHARVHGWRQKGCKDFMRPTPTLVAGNSAADAVPAVVTDGWWDPAKNGGVHASQVSRGVNNVLIATHPDCGHDFETRVNALIPTMERGGKPRCRHAACQPERRRAFTNAKADLAGLVEALGGDPDAFDRLSPALQHSLLARYGFLSNAMGRDLGTSVAHGTLTLADIVRAASFAELEDRVRTGTDDEDDQALGTVIDIHASGRATQTGSAERDVDQILAATGVLDAVGCDEGIDSDDVLVEQVVRESVDSLWERLLDVTETGDDRRVSEFLQMVTSRGRNARATAVAMRFAADVNDVLTFPLPAGFLIQRADGTVKDPTLAQRRFARLAVEHRSFANLSEPGAGKTLGMTVAIGASGAREALVVCPKAVIGQWADEFEAAYGGAWNVQIGLPGTETPSEPTVWIANYDKFQSDAAVLRRDLKPFAARVGVIAYDEIQMVLNHGSDNDANVSRRRAFLEWLTDTARVANPDLMVLGASATPVVNNLDEGQSVLRLIEGRGSKPLATKATVRNAATAYHRFKAISVRHTTKHGVRLTTNECVVDVTSDLRTIRSQVNACDAPTHPASMEKAMIGFKIPAIVTQARDAVEKHGAVVIYSDYVDGMVAPIVEALTAAGMSVARYTGQEDDRTRAANLRAFVTGEVKVLVGSKPLATGVDGLQAVCRRAIVVSPPWTAAADDQFVGRFLRPGQTGDVEITRVVAEARLTIEGTPVVWSWDRDSRLSRIAFKRSLADAVTTGVVPEGILGSAGESVQAALRMLAAA